MLAKVKSFGLNGIDGYFVEVEVDVNTGLPSYDIVGLGDTSVKESKYRVKSAIKNSGFVFPVDKVTINLAPADIKKEGPLFDLAIAIAILQCSKFLNSDQTSKYAFIGELSLNGDVKKVNGILPILITARGLGITNIIIPSANINEASYIEGLNVYGVDSIVDVFEFLTGVKLIPKVELKSFEQAKHFSDETNDFKFIKGQAVAKRAMEIAAAGGHNLLMVPPGSGKSMLAKSFGSILPDLTFEEALEVTKIHSIAGILDNNIGIIVKRPFRSPHHTATTPALTGGGARSKPGEISLAHNGVLFLDELPEYTRQTIETLRQPLEDGHITVSRINQSIDYPAMITLIASMNPCPCGYYGHPKIQCNCTTSQIERYRSKISGPLLDRIDLHVEVDAIEYSDLACDIDSESSASIKKRVDFARKIQLLRFANNSNYCNSKMTNQQIKKYCKIDKEGENLLKLAFDKFNLSARAYTRILKVARTIADLEGSQEIDVSHLAEAIQYRSLDKKYCI